MKNDKSRGKFKIKIKHCQYCGSKGVVPISKKFNEKEKEIIEFIAYLRYRHSTQVKFYPACKRCYVVFRIGPDTITRVKRGEYDEREFSV